MSDSKNSFRKFLMLFRFLIEKSDRSACRYLWARFFIGCLLLIAALLKGYELSQVPYLGEGLLNARWFNIFVVEFELLFSCWLFTGLFSRQSRLLTLGCFAVFTSVSLSRAMIGEQSCGCFGLISVNPRWTVLLDIFVLAVLAFSRIPGSIFRLDALIPSQPAKITIQRRLVLGGFIYFCLIIPVSWEIFSLKTTDQAALNSNLPESQKEIILLEPLEWIDNDFLLLDHLELAPNSPIKLKAELKAKVVQGTWTVILFHDGCSRCAEVLKEYSQKKSENVLCIEIPPFQETPPKIPPGLIHSRLSDARRWFIQYPVVVQMKDGKIVKRIL